MAVKVTIDHAAVFSQPVQVGTTYTVDTRPITDPRRLTIEWSIPSSNNIGNNCESHGSLVIGDAWLYH